MPIMLIVERDELLAGLDRCEPAAEERAAHPFAGLVLLQPSEHALRLCATNLIVSVDTEVQAQVKSPTPIAVHFKRLRSALASMPAGNVKLSIEKGWRLVVACAGQRQYTIAGRNGAEFPKLSQPNRDVERFVAGPELARALWRVKHSISTNRDRPFLDGVSVVVHENELAAVALSGPTLAISREPWTAPDIELFFPSPVLKLAHQLLLGGGVQISKETNTLFLETEQSLICASLPSGEFPPWRRLLESIELTPVCRAPGPLTIDVLKAVSAARTTQDVPLHIVVSGDTMEVSVAHEDCSGRDVIPVEPAGDCDVLVNPSYLLDAVRAADAHFQLKRAQDQLVIETDDGFLAIVARVTS
jgi:DNA polymerase-3 subunit beta